MAYILTQNLDGLAKNHSRSRQVVSDILTHEVEHVVTRALEMVMGVDRDTAQQAKLEKINPDVSPSSTPGVKWKDMAGELSNELRLLGDWLAYPR